MLLVSLNIQYGLGRDGQYDLERTAEAVRGADVIALQEVERYWQRSGMQDQPARIAELLEGYYWVYGANLDVDASYREAQQLVNRRRQFGTMLLSRTPILSSRNHPLPKWGTLTQHSIQQGALEGVVQTATGGLRCYSVHLSHLASSTRLPQIERLLQINRDAYGQGGAWCGGHPNPDAGWTEGDSLPMPRSAVVMGDFNSEANSAEYAQMVGPWAEGYGRLNHREGFVDAWVASGNQESAGNTIFNDRKPGPRRIDYCFVTADIAESVQRAWIDDVCVASDHQPVWTELQV